MTDTKRCKDCIYRGYDHGAVICDYLSIVGHTRGGQPGRDCAVRMTGKKEKTRVNIYIGKQRKWDTVKADAMRAQGMTYPAIAKELGTTEPAVNSYFKQKRKPGRGKSEQPRQESLPDEIPCSRR